MLSNVFLLVLGLVILVWSADRFVEGSAAVGRSVGISSLIIGLTIVSIGTSAPEILVAIVASLEGDPLLAVGNAVGSNICNIGLVLALTAIVVPLPFAPAILKRELPWLLGITVLVAVLILDRHIGRLDGLILLAVLCVLLAGLVRASLRAKQMPAVLREELEDLPEMSVLKAVT